MAFIINTVLVEGRQIYCLRRASYLNSTVMEKIEGKEMAEGLCESHNASSAAMRAENNSDLEL